MLDSPYSKIILSPIAVDDLVIKIADELERRAAIRALSSSETTPQEPIRLYGDKAAANHIGCTAQAIGKLRKAEKINYYTTGTRYYYYAHELDQDLRGGKHRFGELRGRRGKK